MVGKSVIPIAAQLETSAKSVLQAIRHPERSEANDFAPRGGWTRAQPKDLAVFSASDRNGFDPLQARPIRRFVRTRLSGPIGLQVEATQVLDSGSLLRRAVTASQRNNCRAQHLAVAQDDGIFLRGALSQSIKPNVFISNHFNLLIVFNYYATF
ncbi:MAG: hypothetical protein LV480_08325 [Methylacidiphilales bacterium]|nr:hypothetical protein [Candidatus Methylacidiphilales bacterium]